MKTIKKSICIILALVSILSLNACGGNGEKESETYPPAQEMTVEKIVEDYNENTIRADKTHIGQRYRCKVKVFEVREEYVRAEIDAINSLSVALLYYQGQEDFVMNLSKNDVIIFEGTFTRFGEWSGFVGNHEYFEDVVFISKVD